MELIPLLKQLYNKTIIDENSNCFIYKGKLDKEGYGHIYLPDKQRNFRLNRLSAHIFLNLDLKNTKLQANHKLICKNKSCWNPFHLYVGTQQQNRMDSIWLGTSKPPIQTKKKYCKRHHLLIDNNIIIRKNGERQCKICHIEYRRKYNIKRNAEAALLRNKIK